jgi:hypothetical protein
VVRDQANTPTESPACDIMYSEETRWGGKRAVTLVGGECVRIQARPSGECSEGWADVSQDVSRESCGWVNRS